MKKINLQYLRVAKEKRFEIQIMQEASKVKHEQILINKIEYFKKEKDYILAKEAKKIYKKEKEAKKLELLEGEILKRLRETIIK
jgi:hypothetical protein